MPYGKASPEQNDKIDRCVEKLMAQGRNKSSAIAICYDSIVNKEFDCCGGSNSMIEFKNPIEKDRKKYMNLASDTIVKAFEKLFRKKELGIELSDSPVLVFKQADGLYRWVTISSTAYRDRDRHIVSTLAHDEDAKRMNQLKDFGVLRYWHVGFPESPDLSDWTQYKAGVGIDLGECDFSQLIGKSRVESGTFYDEAVAKKIAASPSRLAVSAGFSHPIDEPDSEGIFTHIKTFERSLLPSGQESNFFTSLFVSRKENLMAGLDEKLAQLESLIGKEGVAAITSRIQKTDKAAKMIGVDFKEKKEEDASATPSDPPPVANLESPSSVPAPDPVTPSPELISEKNMSEMEGMIEKCVSKHMQSMMSEMKNLIATGITSGMEKKEASLSSKVEVALKEARDRDEAILVALKAITAATEKNSTQILDLMGDLPKSVADGFRASESSDTDLDLPALKHLKGKNPQADPKQYDALTAFVNFAATGRPPVSPTRL